MIVLIFVIDAFFIFFFSTKRIYLILKAEYLIENNVANEPTLNMLLDFFIAMNFYKKFLIMLPFPYSIFKKNDIKTSKLIESGNRQLKYSIISLISFVLILVIIFIFNLKI